MADPDSEGWERSAAAWIAAQGDDGDFTRKHVLDAVMRARVAQGGFTRAIDIGCGEGRFARMLSEQGIATIGIDPAPSLIAEAQRDPTGDYRIGSAAAIDLPDSSVDLVVSYLSLIDIAALDAAIAEMVRVLAPGGTLLIANLTSFNTAGADRGWVKDLFGRKQYYPVDHYLAERGVAVSWKGISITNWHRPLAATCRRC